MALVYGNDAADFFFSLLNGTLVTEVDFSRSPAPLAASVACKRTQVTLVSYVSYTHHQTVLEQPILTAAPGLAYDDAKKRFSFTGALSAAVVTAVKAAADGAIADSAAKGLFKSAVDRLYAENQKVVTANLEQPIVDAAPGLVYDGAKKQLSFAGVLSATAVTAVKAAADSAITDSDERALFKSAVDRLSEETQQVVNSNLEQPIVDAASGRIVYNDFRKRLSYAGVLSDDAVKAITADDTVKAITDNDTRELFKKTLARLSTKNGDATRPFFTRYPELRPLYEAYDFFSQLCSSVPYTQPQAELDGSITRAAPGRLTYDGNLGQLSYAGAMSDAVCNALKNASGATQQFQNAVDGLYAANHGAVEAFFAKHPALAGIQEAYRRADPSPAGQRSVLLEALMPELKRRRRAAAGLAGVQRRRADRSRFRPGPPGSLCRALSAPRGGTDGPTRAQGSSRPGNAWPFGAVR